MTLLGGGILAGPTLPRTVFYTPFFVSGVATFILWKKLFNAQQGPINEALRPVLGVLGDAVNALPGPVAAALPWASLAAFGLVLWFTLVRLLRWHRDGDAGTGTTVASVAVVHVPLLVACVWSGTQGWMPWTLAVAAAAWAAAGLAARKMGPRFGAGVWAGGGTGFVFAVLMLTAMFLCVGGLAVLQALPAMASDGLEPPRWLTQIQWAKPSLMAMGFWAAIGSNNMLLYLAAPLQRCPAELYEAADIDGARGAAALLERHLAAAGPDERSSSS